MSWRGDPKPDLGLSSDGTMEDGRGARHPINKPITRSCLNRRALTKPEKKPQPARYCADYALTSYAAWFKRIDKSDNQFWKEVEKEESFRRQKKEKLKKKQEQKETFIKKFFPGCNNSPGGTFRLRGGDRNINSTECVAMGKIWSEESRTTLNPLKFNFTRGESKIGVGYQRTQLSDFLAGTEWTKKANMEKDKISGSRNYLGQ